jgi:hypothetical protein
VCVTPLLLSSGVKVACGRCRLCRDNRVNDFVGRCVAEQSVSSEVMSLTLTYRGDPTGAYILDYRDVQRMLYRLRSDGFAVRYIVAGEHGERKGRAHWHCILFFSGPKVPGVAFDVSKYDWKYWPHGFTYFRRANYEGFRYLLKYTLKQDELYSRGQTKKVRMSKKPPLGFHFFQELADRMVDGCFALHNPEYSFAACRVRGPDGKYRPRKFWLSDTSFRMFSERYVARWAEVHGGEPPGTPFLHEKHFDPIARREVEDDPLKFEAELKARRPVVRRADPVSYARQCGFFLLPPDVGGLVIRYSDRSAVLTDKEGERWHLEINGGVRKQLEAAGLPRWLQSDVSVWLDPLGQQR